MKVPSVSALPHYLEVGTSTGPFPNRGATGPTPLLLGVADTVGSGCPGRCLPRGVAVTCRELQTRLEGRAEEQTWGVRGSWGSVLPPGCRTFCKLLNL